jgi:hypothetical protein
MYSAENYHWGLVGYYLGSVLLIMYAYRFRKILPGRHFRNLLVLLIAVVILVPIKAYIDSDFLAPAWFVSIFEGLTEESEQAYLRGLQPIMVCYLVAVVIYILWVVFGPRRVKEVSQETAQGQEQKV